MTRLIVICMTCAALFMAGDVFATPKKKLPTKFRSSGAAGRLPAKTTTTTTEHTTTDKTTTTTAENDEPHRQPDSTTSDANTGGRSESAFDRTNGDRPYRIKLGLVGGFASVSSNNTREQAARDNTNFNRNGYIGLNTDFQYGKYFGNEIDAYYSTGKSTMQTATNPITGSVTTADRGLKQYGGMIDVQGRYSLEQWGRSWNFKLGAGYGLNNVRKNNPVTALSGSPETGTFKVNGPYAVVGLDVHAIPKFPLFVDYSRSFFASGTNSETPVGGAASTDTSLDSPRFERIRVGAAYEITTQFAVGLQYVRRQLRGTPQVADGSLSTETSNQFLANLSYTL